MVHQPRRYRRYSIQMLGRTTPKKIHCLPGLCYSCPSFDQPLRQCSLHARLVPGGKALLNQCLIAISVDFWDFGLVVVEKYRLGLLDIVIVSFQKLGDRDRIAEGVW